MSSSTFLQFLQSKLKGSNARSIRLNTLSERFSIGLGLKQLDSIKSLAKIISKKFNIPLALHKNTFCMLPIIQSNL